MLNDLILELLLAIFILLERPVGSTFKADHKVMFRIENMVKNYIRCGSQRTGLAHAARAEAGAWPAIWAGPVRSVRKVPCRPRSWANVSLLQLHSHRNAWANSYLLGKPDTVLAPVRSAPRSLKTLLSLGTGIVVGFFRPGPPRGRLGALRVSHSESVPCGDFVWAHRALHGPKRRPSGPGQTSTWQTATGATSPGRVCH